MTISEAWTNVQVAAGPICERYTRERPEWVTTDSPLKYVDPARALESTFAKSALLAQEIEWGPAPCEMFEIGPGAGYLLYLLRECYGWEIYGCDVPDRPLYRDALAALNVDTVSDWTVKPGESIVPMVGPYDLIIGTQVSWLNNHDAETFAAFVADCRSHLTPGGALVLFLNPQALSGRDHAEALAPYCPGRLSLPFLGNGFVIHKEDHQ
jgi:hypothetical protein